MSAEWKNYANVEHRISARGGDYGVTLVITIGSMCQTLSVPMACARELAAALIHAADVAERKAA